MFVREDRGPRGLENRRSILPPVHHFDEAILLPREHIFDGAVAVAKESFGCKPDPQIVLVIRKQAEHAAGRKGGRSPAIQKPKAYPIETHQTLLGSDPQVAVPGLRDGMNRAPGKSLLGAPLIAGDFGERPL